jgi:hypothetical protein
VTTPVLVVVVMLLMVSYSDVLAALTNANRHLHIVVESLSTIYPEIVLVTNIFLLQHFSIDCFPKSCQN